MADLQWPAKDPDEVLDYVVDWTSRLNGDTISTSTFTADTSASGVTVNTQSKTNTDATVWLGGGTAGASANILNRIVTAGGRTMDQTIVLPIRAK